MVRFCNQTKTKEMKDNEFTAANEAALKQIKNNQQSKNQFRKGDYVLHNGKVERVWSCTKHTAKLYGIDALVTMSSLTPIPLTEDWLRRLGFENYDWDVWELGQFTVNTAAYFSVINEFEVHHVHQLQGIHEYITGEPLRIINKLPE